MVCMTGQMNIWRVNRDGVDRRRAKGGEYSKGGQNEDIEEIEGSHVQEKDRE